MCVYFIRNYQIIFQSGRSSTTWAFHQPVPFYSYATNIEYSNCFTSFPTLALAGFRCSVVSHYGFNFVFLWLKMLYVFSWAFWPFESFCVVCPFKSFAHFYFLIIELQECLYIHMYDWEDKYIFILKYNM
jgi:hypothetical protein